MDCIWNTEFINTGSLLGTEDSGNAESAPSFNEQKQLPKDYMTSTSYKPSHKVFYYLFGVFFSAQSFTGNISRRILTKSIESP